MTTPPTRRSASRITKRRIVYRSIGAVLRMAAMVDIGGEPGIDEARIALLKRQAGDTVLRPCRPGHGKRLGRPAPRHAAVG